MKSHICLQVSSMALLIGAMLIAVPSIHAESLTILSHSFENGVMDAANNESTSDWGVGGYDVSNAGGWINDDLDANIYRPTTAEYTDPGVVPDGEKVAWVLGIANYDNGIRQILASNLVPNLTYTLNVAIGNPALYNVPPPAPNYRIELLGGVLLASSSGSPPANDSAFKTATLTYSSGPSPPQTTAAAFVPANAFSSWISNSAFGLAIADQDLGDDPDGDGIHNGVENFFGTNPGTCTPGLAADIKNGNSFTFTHPQGTPASDLSANYRWSTDFAAFHLGSATSGGTNVNFTTEADTPSPGFTRLHPGHGHGHRDASRPSVCRCQGDGTLNVH